MGGTYRIEWFVALLVWPYCTLNWFKWTNATKLPVRKSLKSIPQRYDPRERDWHSLAQMERKAALTRMAPCSAPFFLATCSSPDLLRALLAATGRSCQDGVEKGLNATCFGSRGILGHSGPSFIPFRTIVGGKYALYAFL